MRYIFILLLFLVSACSPKSSSLDLDKEPLLFSFYSTSATESQVPLIYSCAEETRLGLASRTSNINEADIALHIGAAENGYNISDIELVVIGNNQNANQTLSKTQVADIFKGKITNWSQIGGEDAPIKLWVYDKNNEIQIIFDKTTLGTGIPPTMARQAQNMQEMRREIAQDTSAIGISTKAELSTNLHILYSIGDFPILAVTKDEPEEIIISVINCLQEN